MRIPPFRRISSIFLNVCSNIGKRLDTLKSYLDRSLIPTVDWSKSSHPRTLHIKELAFCQAYRKTISEEINREYFPENVI
ncbi:MAG UNVERIFIED_CONTAM: hypothetical protein LVR29_24745 [Microcystis novacekii LVE1205-3]